MVKIISDHWEKYSHAEFTLRKSLLFDHVQLLQTENVVIFEQVLLLFFTKIYCGGFHRKFKNFHLIVNYPFCKC